MLCTEEVLAGELQPRVQGSTDALQNETGVDVGLMDSVVVHVGCKVTRGGDEAVGGGGGVHGVGTEVGPILDVEEGGPGGHVVDGGKCRSDALVDSSGTVGDVALLMRVCAPRAGATD